MQTFPANITTVASFMPLPFILNTNSPEAFLFGDFYNGTQPDNAGIYNCVANGEIRAGVEILVLGKALIALNIPVSIIASLYAVSQPPLSLSFLRLSSLPIDLLNEILGFNLNLDENLQILSQYVRKLV